MKRGFGRGGGHHHHGHHHGHHHHHQDGGDKPNPFKEMRAELDTQLDRISKLSPEVLDLQDKLQKRSTELLAQVHKNEQLELEKKTWEAKALAYEDLCEKLKKDISSQAKGGSISDVELQEEKTTKRQLLENENQKVRTEQKIIEEKYYKLEQELAVAKNQDIINSLENEKEFWKKQYQVAKGIAVNDHVEKSDYPGDKFSEKKDDSERSSTLQKVPESTLHYNFSKIAVPDPTQDILGFISGTFDLSLSEDIGESEFRKEAVKKLFSYWILKNWNLIKNNLDIKEGALEFVNNFEADKIKDVSIILKALAINYEVNISIIRVTIGGMMSVQIPPEKEIKFENRMVLIQDCRETDSGKYEVVFAKSKDSGEEARIFDSKDQNSKEQALKLAMQMTTLL